MCVCVRRKTTLFISLFTCVQGNTQRFWWYTASHYSIKRATVLYDYLRKTLNKEILLLRLSQNRRNSHEWGRMSSYELATSYNSSMKTYSSTPQKQNQCFVKEHNRTALRAVILKTIPPCVSVSSHLTGKQTERRAQENRGSRSEELCGRLHPSGPETAWRPYSTQHRWMDMDG